MTGRCTRLIYLVISPVIIFTGLFASRKYQYIYLKNIFNCISKSQHVKLDFDLAVKKVFRV